ncbi:hypothetical protein DPMN_068935 [Dreissena polymorpha]|uniref:Sulfotransferase n=1 Tax=Dreissena polymorpha TaxID=45954 RepID=A0A9D4BUM0_DREPO|nr:hypothetical protein DPMN_068935 [Dreissena polymorpha]
MCAKQLQTVCTESSFRIVKTIRLEMSSVTHLLGMFPNLKTVHLVRDPRATLVSQAYVGMCSGKHGGMLQCANNLCKRVENDILEKERIMSELPGRIFPVVYEDIAREPIETAKKLFDFIGADFTEEAKEYIFNITKAGQEDNCAICTTRSNSTKHIDAWKTEMKTTLLNVVQERCNYVLRRYNYTILPYES